MILKRTIIFKYINPKWKIYSNLSSNKSSRTHFIWLCNINYNPYYIALRVLLVWPPTFIVYDMTESPFNMASAAHVENIDISQLVFKHTEVMLLGFLSPLRKTHRKFFLTTCHVSKMTFCILASILFWFTISQEYADDWNDFQTF